MNSADASPPLRLSLRKLGTFLQFACIGVVLDWMLFAGTQASLWVQFMSVGLLVFAAWKWSGIVLLVAIQFSLFIREPGRSSMIPELGAWLYCALGLFMTAYACWSKASVRRMSDWFADRMLQSIQARSPAANERIGNRQSAGMRQLAVEQLWIVGYVLLAMFFMTSIPLTASVQGIWLEQAKANDFVLWPGATMVAVAIAALVVVRDFAWRQMSTAQASLYLKSLFVADHFADLKMIVLRRLKQLRKERESVKRLK